jgi:hypothetical protein
MALSGRRPEVSAGSKNQLDARFLGALYEFSCNASLNAEDFFSNRESRKLTNQERSAAKSVAQLKRIDFFSSFAYDRIKIE